MSQYVPLFLSAAALAACTSASPPVDAPYTGHGVAIDIAALALEGVGDVVWDLEVDNGAGDVVWQRRVTSSGYGDSAGSASYLGPCDADPAVAENTVKVWVVGVYAADVASADAGSFNAGSTAGAGAVTGTSVPFQNPTTTGPLTRAFTCVANADVAVQLDVALMRPAQQGFFDIAVNFNDIFCSAKFDCCRDTDGNGCAADGSEDIDLLFDASGARARTLVLGFACTAGTDAGVVTDLYMDDLALDCTAPNAGTDFVADLTLSPDGPGGNQCVAGPDGMTSCLGTVSETGAFDADTVLFQVAVYRGDEALTSGGTGANKSYWNVALGAKAGISACRLRTRATADDGANTGDHVDGGVIAPGTVYPYVSFEVDLGSCGSEPMTFGVPGAPVEVAYAGTADATSPFGYTWATSLPSGPVCADGCANGGTCAAPGLCDCASAPGWTGPTCEQLDCGGTLYRYSGAVQSFGQVQPFSGGYLLAGRLPGNEGAIFSFDASLGFLSGAKSAWRDNGYLHALYPVDTGFFAIGGGYTPTTNGDPWVMRLGSDGAVQWSRTYGHFSSSYGDNISWLSQTADGGFVTTGTNGSTGASDQGANLYRYDSNFGIQWGRFVGYGYDTYFSMVKELPGGGFIVTGGTSWSGAGGWDGLVARLDTAGNFVWAKRFGTAEDDRANGVVLTDAGDLVVWGYTYLGGDQRSWAARMDVDANVAWTTTFGTPGRGEVLDGPHVRTAGGTVIVGSATDAISQDGLVVSLGDDGTVAWGQAIGGAGSDSFNGITSTVDGDYLISGTSDSWSGGGNEGILVVLPEQGRFGCGGTCNADYAPTTTSWPELTISDYARSTSATSMGQQDVTWSGTATSLTAIAECVP